MYCILYVNYSVICNKTLIMLKKEKEEKLSTVKEEEIFVQLDKISLLSNQRQQLEINERCILSLLSCHAEDRKVINT